VVVPARLVPPWGRSYFMENTETKVCNKCGLEKHISCFREYKKYGKVYIRGICKTCNSEYSALYNKNNEEKVKAARKRYVSENPDKEKERHHRYDSNNRDKRRMASREYRNSNKEKCLWKAALERSQKSGLEFTISIDDVVIPEVCPVLGIPIKVGEGCHSDNSPSLDRIDNTKGYVKGNVCVISYKANAIKNTGSADEHRKVAEYIERMTH
jgi:hypothetical protein